MFQNKTTFKGKTYRKECKIVRITHNLKAYVHLHCKPTCNIHVSNSIKQNVSKMLQ